MQTKTKLAAAALSASAGVLGFIAQEEGTKYDAYLDPIGIPTICTGSTRAVYLGQSATKEECEVRLQEDVSYAGRAVARYTDQKLTQSQYDALVSFVFNVGEGNYRISHVRREINAGNCYKAAKEFNAMPQIDRNTGKPRIWQGSDIIDRQTGEVLLAQGDPIMKWTTAAGRPLPGLIKRRAAEREMFEEDCHVWDE